MSLTTIISIIVVGGIAAGAFFYRGSIKNAFTKSEEQKQYEHERRVEQDQIWDKAWYNPNNWFGKSSKPSDNTKQIPKYTPILQPIRATDPTTGQATTTVVPNTTPKAKQRTGRWY